MSTGFSLNPSSRGGGEGWVKYAPLLFFHHHPKEAQDTKLKLSDFKDTPLTHLLHVKPVRYILSCQNLAPKKSELSAICKDIELKVGIETKFGPLSSKTNTNLQFRPFRLRKHKNDVIVTSYIKI